VFVNGCKPIKASKLRYDREPVFRDRLLPAPRIGDGKGGYPGLTDIPSPWWGLSVQTKPTRPPKQPPAAPEWVDDVPDFQPEW
jgi:type IV secretion system protein VirD4